MALTRRRLLAGAASAAAVAVVPGAQARTRRRQADVAIVGAGLSGLAAARVLAPRGPQRGRARGALAGRWPPRSAAIGRRRDHRARRRVRRPDAGPHRRARRAVGVARSRPTTRARTCCSLDGERTLYPAVRGSRRDPEVRPGWSVPRARRDGRGGRARRRGARRGRRSWDRQTLEEWKRATITSAKARVLFDAIARGRVGRRARPALAALRRGLRRRRRRRAPPRRRRCAYHDRRRRPGAAIPRRLAADLPSGSRPGSATRSCCRTPVRADRAGRSHGVRVQRDGGDGLRAASAIVAVPPVLAGEPSTTRRRSPGKRALLRAMRPGQADQGARRL